jgi:hypothetical protein
MARKTTTTCAQRKTVSLHGLHRFPCDLVDAASGAHRVATRRRGLHFVALQRTLTLCSLLKKKLKQKDSFDVPLGLARFTLPTCNDT